MIERRAKDAFVRLASQFPVVAVTGPRQAGKTTLAQMVFPDKQYVSFDDAYYRELAKNAPKDFLLAFPDGVIIDEAQKAPAIFDAVKLAVDQDPYHVGKFIITGSSQLELKNMADSLAGRIAFLRLLPFSIGELKEEGLLPHHAHELAFTGQYPPLYDINRQFIVEDWFDNYIDSYLDLDVRGQINPSNLTVFKKFIQFCATYSAQMLSMEGISKAVGVSAPTVKSWLSILEASYIIHFLQPAHNNLGKTLVKTPKLYFVDSGLLCHLLRIETKEQLLLSPHKGAVIETMAVCELLKDRFNQGRRGDISYFRDLGGFEVDTIADWNHTYAIEIKSDGNLERKYGANTRKYLELSKDADVQGVVFYLGDISCTVDGIRYVSWKDWPEIPPL